MTSTPSRPSVSPSARPIDPHAVTISGLVLDPSYGPTQQNYQEAEALKNLPRDLPAPGQYPFTRGLFPQGYRSRLWTMRQFAGFGSADDTNKRFKYLLEQAKSSTAANTGL
ncbi:MAG TPA: methylmalonyl-CoA mutase family protein, partial [Phycisphaerales bacterium]|nr:methylmalonyl-CoA mutase family protein [Phycisphaerales bacterium]